MMRKLIIIILLFLFLSTFILFGSGCTYGQQPVTTIATAIESSAAETTLLELPSTETAEIAKVAGNFNMLYVTKLEGIPWFEVVKKGIEQCASDYGFTATIISPPKADPAIQTQIVLDNISKGFSAIVACPLDEAMMDSAFERANKAGVMTFSNEGYTLKNVTFDIEAFSDKEFGEAIMESGIKYSGGTGNYILSVGFLDSLTQNAWADYEIAYQQANAPGLANIMGYAKNSDRFEDNEDETIAAEKIKGFFDAGNEIRLIAGNSFSTGLAAGEYISKKRLKGKTMFVGTGLPSTIGEYIGGEVLQEGFFWDPYLIGYTIGYVAFNSWMEQVKAGDPVVRPDGTIMPGYGSLGIGTNKNGGPIIYGNAIASMTKDNLEEWYNKFIEYGWPQK